MVYYITALAIILSLCGCGKRPGQQPDKKKKATAYTILALGDSLTAGFGVSEENSYPSQLARRLKADGLDGYRVINAGVSGETSSGTLSRLNWILSMHPDIVILETGANDGLRGITPVLTKKNIKKIIQRLQGKNIQVVLAGMKMVMNLGTDYTNAFNRIYPQIAKEEGVIFMPFFLEGVASNPGLNISDGIHPTAAGYKIVVDNLLPYVRQAIKQLNEDKPKS